jgi:protein involved in polysaccharide export with SLBB domain
MTKRAQLAGGLLILGLVACGAPFHDSFIGPIDGTLDVTTMESPAPARPPYRIQPGDGLAIRFYRNPELNTDVTVRPDGMISLPLVDDVPAADRTPLALGGDLEARYTGELAVPDVTVIVTTFAAQKVFVGGEVETAGEQDLGAGLTMLSAIEKAGGFKNSARVNQVILIRRGEDGRPRGRSIDFEDIVSGEHPEGDVVLQAFDVVVVPKSSIANVNVFVEQYIARNIPVSPAWLALAF